jgi:hypothetical protein
MTPSQICDVLQGLPFSRNGNHRCQMLNIQIDRGVSDFLLDKIFAMSSSILAFSDAI